MASSERQYEIVLLGASGYTGKYTAEYITKLLPTDLKWAVAGRSAAKLTRIVEDARQFNPDRQQPAVEVCTLNPAELDVLTKKTTVLINAVGPYYLYSEPVVKACAENGTHYVDCTGEVPWVKRMIAKYEQTAKKNGAIIIPQSGFESTPSDLLAWSLVDYIRTNLHSPTRDLTTSIHEFNSKRASGGTLATALGLISTFSLRELGDAIKPWSLAPTPGKEHARPSLWTMLTGLRTAPSLGLLTTSITAASNAPIVQRSAVLQAYGREFRYEEYMKPRNAAMGVAIHWALLLGSVMLALPPVRWLVGRLAYAPGDGPSRETVEGDHAELRATAEADEPAGGKRVNGRIRWQGSMYDWTGACLAVASGILARNRGKVEAGFGTPASLGGEFVKGLEGAGMVLEVREE